MQLTAPFRWAGSKAKLTRELFTYFKDSDTYIEPFLGSGVVLFRLIQDAKYKKYVVNDINLAIINFYIAVRDNPGKVVSRLSSMCFSYNSLLSMAEREQRYYYNREVYNLFKGDWESFWFLMKTGFNGLYRENSKGKYNVPFGKKKRITFNADQIYKISELIQNVEFHSKDYKDFLSIVIKQIEYNKAFIYNDPPYVGSQQYTALKFDNEELADYLRSLNYDVAISDVDSKASNDVYKGFFTVQVKDINRVINIASVQAVKEVLYINYPVEGIES